MSVGTEQAAVSSSMYGPRSAVRVVLKLGVPVFLLSVGMGNISMKDVEGTQNAHYYNVIVHVYFFQISILRDFFIVLDVRDFSSVRS